MRRLSFFAALISCLALIGVACGGGDDSTATPKATNTPALAAIDLSKDDLGRSVTVPSNPQRIVAMSPTVVEMLYAVGATPIGRPVSADFPEAAKSVPNFGDSYSPNYEVIAQMKPDLIIADAIIQATTIDELAKLGAPVYALKVGSVDEVLHGLRVMGALTGRREAGDAKAAELSQKLDDVVAKLPATGPSVLVLVGAGPGSFVAARDNSYLGSILLDLKAKNAVTSEPENFRFPGFTDYSPERIIEKNPDVILTISIGGRAGTPTTADALKSSPALSQLTAVKQGRVYELNAAVYVQSAGPRLSQILDELPKYLYPTVFTSTIR